MRPGYTRARRAKASIESQHCFASSEKVTTSAAGRTLPPVPRRRSFSSQLYRAARISNDLSAVASGNPRRVARRAKNVAVGRALSRGGLWRWLWK
jgi:hypothetical protein